MKKTLLATIALLISTTALAGPHIIEAEKDSSLLSIAYVEKVEIAEKGEKHAKLISVTGGDPVMNAVSLYLAVYNADLADYNLYRLGMLADYKLLQSKKKGFLKIAITRDTVDSNDRNFHVKSTLFVDLMNSNQDLGQIKIEEIK